MTWNWWSNRHALYLWGWCDRSAGVGLNGLFNASRWMDVRAKEDEGRGSGRRRHGDGDGDGAWKSEQKRIEHIQQRRAEEMWHEAFNRSDLAHIAYSKLLFATQSRARRR
jgi:hypothetical protein